MESINEITIWLLPSNFKKPGDYVAKCEMLERKLAEYRKKSEEYSQNAESIDYNEFFYKAALIEALITEDLVESLEVVRRLDVPPYLNWLFNEAISVVKKYCEDQ